MRTLGVALLLILIQDKHRLEQLDAKLDRGIKERSPRLSHEAIRDLLKIGTPEAVDVLLGRGADVLFLEDAARLKRYIIADRFWERIVALEKNDRAGDPKLNGYLEELREAHKSMHLVVDMRREMYEGVRGLKLEALQGAVLARLKKAKFWLERANLVELVTDAAPLIEAFKSEPEPTVQVAILDRLAALPAAPESAKLFSEGLKSDYTSIRFASLYAMRRHGSAEFLDTLVPLRETSRGRLQAEIEQAVRELSKNQAPHDPPQWTAWWRETRERVLKEGFQPAPANGGAQATQVVDFFTLPLHSIQLAFVIDCSESMKSSAKWDPAVLLGAKGEKAKPDGARRVDIAEYQLGRAFQSLPENARFAVVLFSTGARTFESSPQTLTQDMRKKVKEFVSKLHPEENTDILAGMDSAMLYAGRRDGRIVKDGLDTIYLLSDGDASEGPITGLEALLEEITYRNRYAKTAIHAIFIGRDGQEGPKQFMQNLASRNWGAYAKATQ